MGGRRTFHHEGTEDTEDRNNPPSSPSQNQNLNFEPRIRRIYTSLRVLRASVVKKTACTAAMLALAASGCRAQQGNEVDPALIAAADSLMPQLELISGLHKLRPITMRQQTREELRKYVEERLHAEMPPEEMNGMQAAYSALGLISDTLNLEKLLLDLYAEQVAGYYDPTTDAFYMVEGTPRDLLRPTLAHELVHALQDQHANLDSLISRKRGNDRQTAAQAAIEGHATLVMFAVLASGGNPNFNPAILPDMGQQLGVLMEAQNSQFPVFRSAPRIIRETMLFPYIGGASFVQQMWRRQTGTPNQFAAPLHERLPQSTEQVLHPSEKFIATPDAPTEIRFTQEIPGKLLYENTLGELEIGIMLQEHLGNKTAAAGWDGDRYRVVEQDGKQILVWQSVWDDAASADRFMRAYQQVAQKRTNRAIRVERNMVGNMNGVWIVDAPSGTNVIAIKSLPATIQQ